jgi:hypothetical protein
VPENLAAGWALAHRPVNSNATKHKDFSIKNFKQDVAFISLSMMNKKLQAIFLLTIKFECNKEKA